MGSDFVHTFGDQICRKLRQCRQRRLKETTFGKARGSKELSAMSASAARMGCKSQATDTCSQLIGSRPLPHLSPQLHGSTPERGVCNQPGQPLRQSSVQRRRSCGTPLCQTYLLIQREALARVSASASSRPDKLGFSSGNISSFAYCTKRRCPHTSC